MGRAAIARGEAHQSRGVRWASRRVAAFDPPYNRLLVHCLGICERRAVFGGPHAALRRSTHPTIGFSYTVSAFASAASGVRWASRRVAAFNPPYSLSSSADPSHDTCLLMEGVFSGRPSEARAAPSFRRWPRWTPRSNGALSPASTWPSRWSRSSSCRARAAAVAATPTTLPPCCRMACFLGGASGGSHDQGACHIHAGQHPEAGHGQPGARTEAMGRVPRGRLALVP